MVSVFHEKNENKDFRVITPMEVARRVFDNADILFLDIRSASEYSGKSGRFAHAKHIPHGELKNRMHEIESYKDKEIVVCCEVGFMSYLARSMLKKRGFSKVSSLLGGIRTANKKYAKQLSQQQKSSLFEQ